MKDITCFLCVNPSAELLEFAMQLYSERYDVYIAVDNEDAQLPDKQPIRFINISRREAESMGYKNTLEYWRGKFIGRAAARDKALYYFTYKRTDYSHLWLIEDDVFIPSVKTIASIDEKYPRADLLCASNYIKNEGEPLDWHWPLIVKTAKYVFPMACSMICAIRVSRELMRNSIIIYSPMKLCSILCH